MKLLLIIIILISTDGFGQEAKYLSENFEFNDGDIAYMFGNDVKLRDQPNTESEVLSILKIGEKIKILEKSDTKMDFEGILSPWYKIKSKDKVGFVLGSLISLDRATFENSVYLISLKRDNSKLFLKTRVLENENAFKENIAQLLTGEFSVSASGNKGLENVNSIFKIDYLSESCGTNGGGIYLFYDGNNLMKAIDFTQVADADLYWFHEAYIFPNDADGVAGKIVYKSEVGETKDYETEWTESKHSRRILEWNGKQMVPKIETEKD